MTRSSPVNERHLNFGPFESDIERISGSPYWFLPISFDIPFLRLCKSTDPRSAFRIVY